LDQSDSDQLLLKEATLVQTATYGSEYMSAIMATEQIIEMGATLQYLGVLIKLRVTYLVTTRQLWTAFSISSTNGMYNTFINSWIN